MKKRSFQLLAFLAISVLAVSIVTAVWPFSTTGNVVAGPNTDSCMDSDADADITTEGGVEPGVAGIVLSENFFGPSYKRDACASNNNYVREQYCDANGKAKSKTTRCEFGCEETSVTFEGRTLSAGACITPEPSCTELSGSVQDQTGKIYRNSCGTGADRLIYTRYSCDGTEVASTPETCSTRCDNAEGCIGICSETDAENDIDASGIVTLDGTEHPDACSSNNKGVKQFACNNGRLKTIGTRTCGVNRVCVDSADGAYCRDKFAGEEETSATVGQLQARINALEDALCTINANFTFCSSA